MENNLCISKYKDEGDNDNLILLNIKKDITSVNFDKSYLYNNENDIIIEEGKTKFTITKYNKIKNDADSSMNLAECGNKLMDEYNLDNLDNLIILKINSRKDDDDINDKVGFEIYSELIENNIITKLDMNICNGIFKNNEISKCDEYSIESFLDDSCITCNDNYFPIDNENLNQNQNSYIKCYQSPKGYYLDTISFYYKKCYISCEECKDEGNNNIHNCLFCVVDYLYELNIDETINCYQNCDYYFYYNPNNNKHYCTPDYSCPTEFNKLISRKKKCIDDCEKDEDYPYEFRKVCYPECPHNISKKSDLKNFYCDVICSIESPYEIIESQTCVKNCSINERENNKCKMNFISDDIEDIEIENIKQELTNGFDTSNIDEGKNIVIEQKDSTITVTSTKNQKNEKSTNSTIIDLGECENKIKDIKFELNYIININYYIIYKNLL